MSYSDQFSQKLSGKRVILKQKSAAENKQGGKDNGLVDSHLVWFCADFTHQVVLLWSLVYSLLLIKERKAHSAYSPESTEGGIGYNGYKMYKI